MKIRLSVLVGIICLVFALMPRQSPTQAQDSLLTYREVMSIEFEDNFASVRWHPSENRIAVAPLDYSEDEHIYIYDLGSPEPVIILNTKDTLIAWSHDGQHFATANTRYEITLWDIATGEPQSIKDCYPFPGPQHYNFLANSLIWSSDDSYVGYIADNSRICLWHLPTDEIIYLNVKLSEVTERRYIDIQPNDPVGLIDMSWQPNNKTLAVVTNLGDVVLFDAKTFEIVGTLHPPEGLYFQRATYSRDRASDWHPTEEILVISQRHIDVLNEKYVLQGSVTIWDTAQQKYLRSLGNPEEQVLSLEWSLDGTLLAGGLFDGSVHIWDGVTYELLLTTDAPENKGFTGVIAWNYDGQYLALNDGRQLHVFEIIEE